MECPECKIEMGDPVDTTFSNIKTKRADIGQHTGDIYKCPNCEEIWLDDFLDSDVRPWRG